MPELALGAYGVYLLVAFGLRTAVQLRRTGHTGFHGVGGRPGSVEWIAGVGFAVALAIGAAAPVLDILGVVEPVSALDGHGAHGTGVALFLAGLAATFAAQISMGDSWRIGVDPAERTSLVTRGAFRLVRNPIFAAMLPTSLGLALMVPSVVAFAGLVALFVALELQVRVVEEPHLARVHGDAYLRYARRTGRFLPGVGRLPRAGHYPAR